MSSVSTWAIGDLQGCRAELEDLLDAVSFDASRDRLWLLGDLINRGPDYLDVLRLLKTLPRKNVKCVLGNHDLHMLAILWGGHSANRGDTFADVLSAPDVQDLAEWLASHKLFHWDESLGFAMAHAGVPHTWSFAEARDRSAEVMEVINSKRRKRFFEEMYGNQPDCWDESLRGMDRWRVITNYFTT